ncbi:MAG: hypothetical protein AAF570_27115, partial [Bacteroidota bacterium]
MKQYGKYLALAVGIACLLVVVRPTQKKDAEAYAGSSFHFQGVEGQAFEKPDKRDRMDLALAHEVEMTRDPATGTVPTDRLFEAFRYAETLRNNTRAPLPTVNWTERGPNNVGGRSRTIMVDPNDPSGNTIWVGSVGGGLWRTTDITVATPDWQPANDFFDNIAISTMTYDPSNTQIMYFGTGEGYGNGDAIRGLGIWKSTDGGTSWNQLPSTNNNTFYYVQRVAVSSSGAVFAATGAG